MDGLMCGHELESLDGIEVVSRANQAAAFLRNSPVRRGAWDERETQMSSSPVEVLDHSLPVALFIVRGTRVDIGHAKAECLVEEDRELPGGGGHRLGLSRACSGATIEGAEGATDHFPKRDRLTASPLSSTQATPGQRRARRPGRGGGRWPSGYARRNCDGLAPARTQSDMRALMSMLALRISTTSRT